MFKKKIIFFHWFSDPSGCLTKVDNAIEKLDEVIYLIETLSYGDVRIVLAVRSLPPYFEPLFEMNPTPYELAHLLEYVPQELWNVTVQSVLCILHKTRAYIIDPSKHKHHPTSGEYTTATTASTTGFSYSTTTGTTAATSTTAVAGWWDADTTTMTDIPTYAG